jgi:hypothetical protein
MMPVWAGCAPAMLMCSRSIPTRRAIHKIATSQLTTMVWRINVLFILSSVCFRFQSVLQFFQRQDFQCVHLGERLLRSCELRCNLSVTVAVPLEYDLRMQFALLYPRKE